MISLFIRLILKLFKSCDFCIDFIECHRFFVVLFEHYIVALPVLIVFGIEIRQEENRGSDIRLYMDFLPLHLERSRLSVRSDAELLLGFLMLIPFGGFG